MRKAVIDVQVGDLVLIDADQYSYTRFTQRYFDYTVHSLAREKIVFEIIGIEDKYVQLKVLDPEYQSDNPFLHGSIQNIKVPIGTIDLVDPEVAKTRLQIRNGVW